MSKFYIMKPEERIRFGRKWAYADIVEPSNSGNSDKCPVCGRAVSLRKWLPPYRARLSSSKPEKWGDFVWGAGFLLIVSSIFKNLYESEGLTGIAQFSGPIEILRLGKHKPEESPMPAPIYYLVDIPWDGANQDDIASGVEYEDPSRITCAYCRGGAFWYRQSKIIIQEGTWNGADIFRPRAAPAELMVSERFRDLSEKHHLRNIWLISTENYGWDTRRPGLWYVHD